VVRTLANDDDECFLEGKSLFQQHQDRHSHVLAWLRAFLSLCVGRPSVSAKRLSWRIDLITESLVRSGLIFRLVSFNFEKYFSTESPSYIYDNNYDCGLYCDD
jgi:hypothetical protein